MMDDKLGTKANASGDKKPFERSVYIILGLVSMALIAIGGVLAINSSGPQPTVSSFLGHLFELFITELGVAGFVALILISTIEQFTRDKHEEAANSLIERIKKNLFHAIYRRHIPQEVFEEVERCLLTKNVIRRNYVVYYSLRQISDEEANEAGISKADKDNHLFCDICSTYELENISEGQTDTAVKFSLEKPIDDNLLKHVGIEALKLDGKLVDISKCCVTTESQVEMVYETTIARNAKLKISVRARTIKRKTDSEIWASFIPSDGIRLEVTAPKTISVQAKANHSCGLNYELFDRETKHVWELEHGIFPFQSIIFWWKVA